MVSFKLLMDRMDQIRNDYDKICLYEDMLLFMSEDHPEDEKNKVGGVFGMIHWVYRSLPSSYFAEGRKKRPSKKEATRTHNNRDLRSIDIFK